MVNVKEAVQSATAFISELYDGNELRDLTLEEVELSNGGDYWYITLGFTRSIVGSPQARIGALQEYLNRPTTERVYKVITIKADDGTPVAMKMRLPVAA